MNKTLDHFAHFFYPRASNNQKAKLIHSDTIFAIASLLLALQLLLKSFPAVGIRILGYASNIPPEKVVELTNKKRADAGLTPLIYNSKLAIAAKAKGEHMLAHDYWAHTAPDGTEPWKFFTDVGYKYKYAGENLARDFSNPESAVEAWMASPSHKENILSNRYREIGVAVVEGDLAGSDTTIVVQLFGSPTSATDQVPVAKAFNESTPTPAPTRPPQLLQTIATATPTPTNSPTVSPTTVAITTAGADNGGQLTDATGEQQSLLGTLVSPFNTTKTVSVVTIALILFIMIVDGIVVYKKRIPRLTGRTIAHLAFLGTILAIALLSKAGLIL